MISSPLATAVAAPPTLPAPWYAAEGVRIYQTDAAQVVPYWTEPIDALVCDPPYHLRGYLCEMVDVAPSPERTRREALWFGELSTWYLAWLSILQPLVGKGAAWFFADLPQYAGVFLRALAVLDWRIVDVFCVSRSEVLVRCGGPPLTAMERIGVQSALEAAGHAVVKPPALIAACLQASRLPPDALVMDPFMGDGSALVAARQLGHRAVGIEYRLNRCQVARAALEALRDPARPE